MKWLILFIVTGVILRLLPHFPNFAPVTAIALFGGAYLGKRIGLALPIATIILSDYLMLYFGAFGTTDRFHSPSEMVYSTILFVWGSFVISSLIGLWIGKKKTVGRVAIGAVAASLQFFIITNLGVWLVDNLYPNTLQGLVDCFVAAVPFYRGTFLGDLFYTGLIFGGFELVKNYYKKPKTVQAS